MPTEKLHEFTLLSDRFDFVNIEINPCVTSTKVFIDPYLLVNKNLDDKMSSYRDDSIRLINSFFQKLLDSIIHDDKVFLTNLGNDLHEAKYIILGYGDAKKGKAFGKEKVERLCKSIRHSGAMRSGRIRDISDFALYIPGVGEDLMSDLLANIIYPVLSKITSESLSDSRLSEMYQIRKNIKVWSISSNRFVDEELSFFSYYEDYFLLVPNCICSKSFTKSGINSDFKEHFLPLISKDMKEEGYAGKINRKNALPFIYKKIYGEDSTEENLNKRNFLAIVEYYANKFVYE